MRPHGLKKVKRNPRHVFQTPPYQHTSLKPEISLQIKVGTTFLRKCAEGAKGNKRTFGTFPPKSPLPTYLPEAAETSHRAKCAEGAKEI
jgi:hypothetical protein